MPTSHLQRICRIFPILVGLFVIAPQSLSDTTRALSFLQKEVPAWKTNNGCYSCHNNGDAIRALFFAKRKGWQISATTWSDTINWLREPARWDENKGDPGFSDKRLANLQFATTLLSCMEAGLLEDPQPLQIAALRLIQDQHTDGSWPIDIGTTVGSPATWGTPLATWLAVRVLRATNLSATLPAKLKAEQWLRQAKPSNLLASAALLMFLVETRENEKRQQQLSIELRRAQTKDGGWGPYKDAPPECFDTAIVLLSLAKLRPHSEWKAIIQGGRRYLIAQQNADGSWPATTRPSGGASYAQMMATTGWVTLALLETED